MPVKLHKVRNILVFRNDRFGEFLLNIPAMRALKDTFQGSRMTLVVDPYVEELARMVNFVDEVLIWNNNQHSFGEVFKFSQNLKKNNFDLCVILNPLRELNILSFLSAIPVRVGYSGKWGFLLTHRIKNNKYLANKHEVEYNLELVNVIGAATENKVVSLECKDNTQFDGLKGNLIAIHPWTSDPVKQWPLENFVELAKRIAGNKNLNVVIIGGKNEAAKSRDFFKNIASNVIDYTGKTSLRELAIVLKKCKLLVSADSGPVHLACAVETPVIAIFRNDLPGKTAKRWGPLGQGCAVIERNDLRDITVDEVLNKARGHIQV